LEIERNIRYQHLNDQIQRDYRRYDIQQASKKEVNEKIFQVQMDKYELLLMN
jgi:flavoprotein